jgi:hypothetical protein
MTQAELTQIRKDNAFKLENILNTPGEVERIAKKYYGNRWKIIYADENHPNNVYRERLQKSKDNNGNIQKEASDY